MSVHNLVNEASKQNKGFTSACQKSSGEQGSVGSLFEQVRPPSASLPLDISILTSDIALLSDTTGESHQLGLQYFWENVRGFFVTGKVRSIAVIVVETGAMYSDFKEFESPPVDGDREIESFDVVGLPGKELFGKVSDTMKNKINKLPDSRSPALKNDLKMKIALTLRTLRHHLDSLHEAELSGSLGTVKSSSTGGCLLHVALEMIGCSSIEFGSFLRRSLQKEVGKYRINFQLPETLDGSSCSIALDLEYKVFPWPLMSVEASNLLRDARELTELSFDVIQVVPNAAVDAGLIYGVAMSAEAAMESDLQRYQEMQSLVRQLTRWLDVHDVSLVLRGGKNSGGGFRYDHYFLLIVENTVENLNALHSKDRAILPGKAVLFRYAASEQLLDEGEEVSPEVQDEQQQEINRQYYEYVEKSLQFLDRTALNPTQLFWTNSESRGTRNSVHTLRRDVKTELITEDPAEEKENVSLDESDGLDLCSRTPTEHSSDDEDIPFNYMFDYS